MKKIILIIFLLNLLFITVYSDILPKPKDDKLYTEFISERYAPYLKKPLKSSGYIAMDGENNFILKQLEPIVVEVKKTSNGLFYRRGKTKPVSIGDTDDETFNIFSNQEKLLEKYSIEKSIKDSKDFFKIIPKNEDKITQMLILSINDKVEKLEIIFKDKSKIIYNFYNTVTGISPDEKYFN